MRFRFRLAGILRLRRLCEERELARLMNLRALDSAAMRSELHIEQLSADSRDLGGAPNGTACTAADLQFLEQCLATLKTAAIKARKQTTEARKALHQQEHVFYKARRDAEMLESLRDKEAAAYLHVEERRAQQRLDEAHVLVHSRKTGQASSIDSAGFAQSSYFPRDETLT